MIRRALYLTNEDRSPSSKSPSSSTLLFLMLLVVFAGKVAEADGNVERARFRRRRRRVAAPRPRRRGAGTANYRRRTVAAGVPCLTLTTIVDTDDFRPGGIVIVTVRCEASMVDVTLLGVA